MLDLVPAEVADVHETLNAILKLGKYAEVGDVADNSLVLAASPVELLKIAGVNLETPRPIQEALDVFGEVLDEIEALLAE